MEVFNILVKLILALVFIVVVVAIVDILTGGTVVCRICKFAVGGLERLGEGIPLLGFMFKDAISTIYANCGAC